MPELPSGTVTFLFSDVEGSTELLRRLRDGYAEAMADHERFNSEIVKAGIVVGAGRLHVSRGRGLATGRAA